MREESAFTSRVERKKERRIKKIKFFSDNPFKTTGGRGPSLGIHFSILAYFWGDSRRGGPPASATAKAAAGPGQACL